MESKDDDEASHTDIGQGQAKEGDRKDILRLVMKFAMSENFEQDFEDFASSHKASFLKILIMDAGAEHPMEWHEIYLEYLHTFEGKIERFISSVNYEINDFYEECRILLEHEDGSFGEVRFFLEALLATSEYETFIALMKGEMMQFRRELEDAEESTDVVNISSSSMCSSPKVAPSSLRSSGRLDSKGEPYFEDESQLQQQQQQPCQLSADDGLDSKDVAINEKEEK